MIVFVVGPFICLVYVMMCISHQDVLLMKQHDTKGDFHHEG